MGFNKLIMEGHLCRDVEIKFAQNTGKPYGRSSIAVNSVSGSGENRREEVCFIDVVFFGRTAEIANEYCHKGSHVLLDGILAYETWTDQNGQNRSKHSMKVESLQMLDSKKAENSALENSAAENSQSEFYKQAENSQSEFYKQQMPAAVAEAVARNNAMYEQNDGEIPF